MSPKLSVARGRSLRVFMMSDEFRTRATRYRNLAETLLDPRVIAVVESCARELEMEAMLIETAEDAYCVIPPIRGD